LSYRLGDTGNENTVSLRLKREVDSWRPYAEALRQEDREVFREMMEDISADFMEAIDMAERGYDTEALMMSILINQQKTINWLSNLTRRLQEQQSKKTEELFPMSMKRLLLWQESYC
jgi:hypothetical protein